LTTKTQLELFVLDYQARRPYYLYMTVSNARFGFFFFTSVNRRVD